MQYFSSTNQFLKSVKVNNIKNYWSSIPTATGGNRTQAIVILGLYSQTTETQK